MIAVNEFNYINKSTDKIYVLRCIPVERETGYTTRPELKIYVTWLE